MKRRSINFRTARTIAYSLPRFAAYQQAAFAELYKLVPSASLARMATVHGRRSHLARDINKIGQVTKLRTALL